MSLPRMTQALAYSLARENPDPVTLRDSETWNQSKEACERLQKLAAKRLRLRVEASTQGKVPK